MTQAVSRVAGPSAFTAIERPAKDSFPEEMARVERAAASIFYRYEYSAALDILALGGPGWESLSQEQQARVMTEIDRASRCGISFRMALRRRI